MVLLHGLWMTGLELLWIRHRLRRAGYAVMVFRYATVLRTPAASAARLRRRIDTLGAERLHFVAHSLGGIVLTHLFARADAEPLCQRSGRVVMLGTPLRGSALAERCHHHRWLRWALGRSLEGGLLGDHPGWAGPTELAMIAGSRGIGLGLFFPGTLARPNDGTVAVAETRDAAVQDHLVLPQTHTSLLFSRSVMAAVVRYLDTGRLTPDQAASRSTR